MRLCARVLALGRPLGRQVLEVVVADDEVVGDAEDGGAQRAVAVAHQRAVGLVHLVALIAGRPQAGAAGDGLGVGVVFDGSHFAGEVGGADDVDAGEGEQQHVGGLDQAAGDVAFQGLNFLGFAQAIVVQGQGDAVVLVGGDVAGRGLFGPVEDSLRRCVAGSECRPGAVSDRGLSRRRRGCAWQWESARSRCQANRTLPELVEASGEAGQGGFEVFADLAVQGGAFTDQVAAMADEQLQGGPGVVAGGFEQGEAGDGGAMHGAQVGVVGLVAGIDGLAVLLGDEGVEDAGLEAGGGEGALHEAVIAAGAFDGDEAVVELVRVEGLADLCDGGIEVGAVVCDGGGRDEDAAVEVGEEELGACLGTVEADDAEVFGPDLLDAGMEDTFGLGDGRFRTSGATFTGLTSSHGTASEEQRCGSPHSRS